MILYRAFLFLFISIEIICQTQLSQMQIIEKPVKSSSELVAVRDANGQFCAAIQVISDMEGFKYQSYNGVVRVDDAPGKDMVFLSANERVLEILHTGHEPLKIILSDAGIHLKEREVWILKIKGQAVSNTVSVTLLVDPSDATIEIDQSDAGSGPVFLLSKGNHSIKIFKSNYETVEQVITVDEKNAFFRFVLEMKQDVKVQITTEPDSATVYLDQLKICMTPLAVFFPEGDYQIKIEKQGFLTREEPFSVSPPITKQHFKLEENAGYITVNTDPEASLYINSVLTSQRKNIKLIPGLIHLKVILSKATPLDKQIILKRYEKMTLDLFPEIQTGTIQVAVTPFDAAVELTGDAGEIYTASGMKNFENIPVGVYQIKVNKKGYEEYHDTVELKSDEKIQKEYRLAEAQEIKQIPITILTDPENVALTIDGEQKHTFKNLMLDPGKHTVSLWKYGYQTVKKTISVKKKNEVYSFKLVSSDNIQKLDYMKNQLSLDIKNSQVDFFTTVIMTGLIGWTEYDLISNYNSIDVKQRNLDWICLSCGSFLFLRFQSKLSENIKFRFEKKYLEKTKKAWLNAEIYNKRAGSSRIKVFLLSTLLPGLGQKSCGRDYGTLYLLGFISANVVFINQLGTHQKNLDDYNRLYDLYRNEITQDNRDNAYDAYQKAIKSNDRCNQTLYVMAGVYTLNLLDALIFSPRLRDVKYKISPNLSYSNRSQPILGMQLEVKL